MLRLALCGGREGFLDGVGEGVGGGVEGQADEVDGLAGDLVGFGVAFVLDLGSAAVPRILSSKT